MYQIRHSIDENSKNGDHHNNAKVAAPTAKVVADSGTHANTNDNVDAKATLVNNRRALGDISNIVGANRHSRMNEADKAKKVALPPAAVGRPITRSYGALLAANHRSQVQGVAEAACPIAQSVSGGVVLEELPKRKNVSSSGAATAENVAAAGKLRRGRTLTATLTSRSEAVCGVGRPIIGGEISKLPNIDAEDMGNQLAASDYVEDMYSFYRKTEVQSCVPPYYMSGQANINHKMRAIVVNWLIEVHFKFNLMHETLFLTTNVMDRFLSSQMGIDRQNLQLVGVTSLLIASKYEEIWAPQIDDLIYISDNAYTREQILEMEKTMLNILRFNLCVPTPYMFIVRFLKAANYVNKSGEKLRNLAFYYVELSLVSYEMLKYCPSMLAAAAVYTAQNTLNPNSAANGSPCWSSLLRHHSGYAESQLLECARKMVILHQKSREGELTAVSRKYGLEKYESVSLLSAPTTI